MPDPNQSGLISEESCSCTPHTSMGDDSIQTFFEGDALFDAMLVAIATAKHAIRMESYIFADDEIGQKFAQALCKQAQAGVKVRLLVDAVGSLFQFYRSLDAMFKKAGVVVHHFHPWQWRKPLRYNRRDHRKLLVIDNRVAFLGGFNIHRESSLRIFGEQRWRDTHVSVGGLLAQQAAELFDFFWHGHRKKLPHEDPDASSVLVTNQTRSCRRRMSCIYNDALNNAKKSICLTTPYFVPDYRTQKVLLAAAKRGVAVRILLPQRSDVRLAAWAANAVYARLLDAGIRIFEYKPRMLHAKVVIVDSIWATVGTANMDYRSLFLNYEIILVSRDVALNRVLQKQFETDLEDVIEIHARRWRQRRWVYRLAELIGWSARRWL